MMNQVDEIRLLLIGVLAGLGVFVVVFLLVMNSVMSTVRGQCGRILDVMKDIDEDLQQLLKEARRAR
jgi:hypothetical protein